MEKLNILFLCTGNSCRSQMAEGFCHYFHESSLNSYSAGIEKHGLNPRALKVMAEDGVDISHHSSQLLEELDHIDFDFVITVCSSAHETCPVFPREAKVIHIGFDDPPGLSKDMQDEEEILKIYRRVRDEIKEEIKSLPNKLSSH